MKARIAVRSFAELLERETALCKELGCSRLICGPITTGGLGVRGNLEVFHAAYAAASREAILSLRTEHPIYNQLLIEPELWGLRRAWRTEHPGEEGNPIMGQFYIPFFEAVDFRQVYFIDGWKTSAGARWERDYFTREGNPNPPQIAHLSQDWISAALAEWRGDPTSTNQIDELLRHFDAVPAL